MTEEAISSVADATDCTLVEASSEAAATAVASDCERSAVDDSVLAPVMSQPSLPLAITPAQRRNPCVSENELQRVVQRATDEGLCAMGLRFTQDPAVPSERFETLRQRLGDAFEVIEIDSSPGNEHGFSRMAHSVLTDQVRERDGHPAFEARKRVVAFLNERLSG